MKRTHKPLVVVLSASGAANYDQKDRLRLSKVCRVRYSKVLRPVSPTELARLLRGATYAVLTHRACPDLHDGYWQGVSGLRGVSLFVTGVDRVDVKAMTDRGILLTNLPEYSCESVAEQTLGLMFCMARRIHLSSDKARGRVRQGVSLLGSELRGKRLGILGFGHIGRRVAEMALAIGMRVAVNDGRWPVRDPRFETLSPGKIWSQSDWISLHHPAQRDGKPVYGTQQLLSVKPGAILINTARHALVDPKAVVEAIRRGRLAGYAVDDALFTRKMAGDLIDEGRILQTGHTAWYSREALERGYSGLLENVRRMADGRPINAVNPEAWGKL